ncbi:adenylate kinase-domain-containing protein [Haematococcus lacustris]
MGCGASVDACSPLRVPEANTRTMTGGPMAEAELIADGLSRCHSQMPWQMDGRSIPEHVTIMFVLGGPGSGKSTQCQHLQGLRAVTCLSSGDLLREEVDSGTALGVWAEDLMRRGRLVPLQVTLTLLKRAMLDAADSTAIVIDGFPRCLEQVQLFERTVAPCHAAIFMDVPVEEGHRRRSGVGRRRRSDSSLTVDEQWSAFLRTTTAVRQHYAAQGKAVFLDASRPQPEVTAALLAAFDSVCYQRGLQQQRLQLQADLEGANESMRPSPLPPPSSTGAVSGRQ